MNNNLENTSPSLNTSPNQNPRKKKASELLKNISKNNSKKNALELFNQVLEESTNPLFYNTGFGQSQFDENINFGADIDFYNIPKSLNEARSREQGLGYELGAMGGRILSKAGTEVIKTVGALGGTIAGAAGNVSDLITGEDNTNFLETAFNNDFIKAADKIHKSINAEYLPVYVSETVENGNFLDKVSSLEFWATEGADGIGYLISALAPGAALKSLGAGNKIFGGLTKINSLNYAKNLEKSREALQSMGLSIEGIDNVMIPAVNTYFEAGAEAKGVGDSMDARKDEFKTKFFKDRETFVNGLYNQKQQGIITQDQYDEQIANLEAEAEKDFQLQKGYAMRNTFITNLGVLAIPNYIQSKLLFGKNETKNLLNQVKQPNALKQVGKRIGQSFLSEGSEEVAQTSTEQRNVQRGLQGQLSSSAFGDFDLGRFGEDFIRSLGTTEGQVAGFLGGVLGSPISVVQGYRKDKRDQTENDKLRSKINNAGTAFSDINLPLYQTETAINPETGEEIQTRVKDDKGNDIPIPENVLRVKEALNLLEDKSKQYDEAVQNGDIQTINKLKSEGEYSLIRDFITEEEVSLDALKEHLTTIFPVETKEENKVQTNKENLNRINNIIDQAKHLQKELKSFKDMSTSIIKLDNENADDQQIQSFLNQKGNEFLKLSSDKYFNKKQLEKVQQEKARILPDIIETEILNPDFIEGKTEDIFRTIKVKKDPRLDILNKQQELLEKEIERLNSKINENIWNNEKLNEEFNSDIETDNKIKEELSPEKVNNNDNFINTVRNFTDIKDLNSFGKLPENKELLKNTELKRIYDEKKFELEESKRQLDAELEQQRLQEQERIKAEEKDFAEQEAAQNNDTATSEITAETTNDINLEKDDVTEDGVIIENVVQEGDNKPESEVTTDLEGETKSVKLLSTIRDVKSEKNGQPLFENLIPFVEYERTPRDKSNDKFEFQLGDMSFTTKDVEQAYKKAIEGTASEKDIQLLEEQLPIKVNVTFDKKSVFTFLPSFTKATKDNPNAKEEFELATLPLRKNIIQGVINNKGFKGLTGTFVKQYPGLLKVESGDTKNNILDLQVFEGMTVPQKLEYFKNNTFYIDGKGHFVSTITGETERIEWNKKGDKENVKPGRGEIYLKIPQNNNKPFYLKLNVNRINDKKADAILLIREALQQLAPTVEDPMSLQSMKIDEFLETLSQQDRELVEDILAFEIDFIKNTYKINPQALDNIERLLDLLIYQKSNNPITKADLINDDYGVLFDKVIDDNINDSQEELLKKFIQLKKYNVIITKDSANEFVFDNNDYLRHLLGIDKEGNFYPERQIISTNAVVNQPTFQGYSNIYLSQNVNGVKPPLEKVEKAVENLKVETKKVEEILQKADDIINVAEPKLIGMLLNSLTKDEFETFVLEVYDNKLSNIKPDTFFQGDLLVENLENNDYRTKFINKLIDLKTEFSEIKKICGK